MQQSLLTMTKPMQSQPSQQRKAKQSSETSKFKKATISSTGESCHVRTHFVEDMRLTSPSLSRGKTAIYFTLSPLSLHTHREDAAQFCIQAPSGFLGNIVHIPSSLNAEPIVVYFYKLSQLELISCLSSNDVLISTGLNRSA